MKQLLSTCKQVKAINKPRPIVSTIYMIQQHITMTTRKSLLSTVTPISLVTVCLTLCAIAWCNQRRTVNQLPNAAPSATETADISEEEEAENEYDTISGDYHHYDDVHLNTVSTAMQPESGAGPSHNHINNGEDDHNHDDSDNGDVGADLTVNAEDYYVLDAETAYMTRL